MSVWTVRGRKVLEAMSYRMEWAVRAILRLDDEVVVAAFSGGEREIGRAEVGAVKHDSLVVFEDLHVHG